MISMYPKAEILFPAKPIPSLKDLRGPQWADLVTQVSPLPETHPDAPAFCLLVIERDGCLNCYAGSYKFMRGRAACAKQTVIQFKGSDAELLKMYKQAHKDIEGYLRKQERKADFALKAKAETGRCQGKEQPDLEALNELTLTRSHRRRRCGRLDSSKRPDRGGEPKSQSTRPPRKSAGWRRGSRRRIGTGAWSASTITGSQATSTSSA